MSLRLGDDIDDFCPKCKRLTNHNVLALVEDKPAKVRCRTCYHEQAFRNGIAPPTKRELKKAELMRQLLESGGATEAAPKLEPEPETAPTAPAKKSTRKK